MKMSNQLRRMPGVVSFAVFALASILAVSDAFTTSGPLSTRQVALSLLFEAPEPSTTELQQDTTTNPHNLTPELLKIATAFENIGDDKLRYKQLLFMANNKVSAIDPQACTPENQVPGCLSTVYIDAHVDNASNNNDPLIVFTGDSDGLLTKGLVALLMRGLSGNTAACIDKVDARFIETTGIAASLTPGRNNGFLNMLAVMKRKAWQVDAQARKEGFSSTTITDDDVQEENEQDDGTGGPLFRAIQTSLQAALSPTVLELEDVSEAEGDGTESHFEVYVVSEAFGGLNLVKRHQLVYRSVGDTMQKIEALQIQANTPEEIAQNNTNKSRLGLL